MKQRKFHHIIQVSYLATAFAVLFTFASQKVTATSFLTLETKLDSPITSLPYNIIDSHDPSQKKQTPFNLKDPENVKTEVRYDPKTGKYVMYKKVGGMYIRYPKTFTLEEYLDYSLKQDIKDFRSDKESSQNLTEEPRKNEPKPLIQIKNETLDKIFGGEAIEIRPQGSAELSLGVNSSKVDNPTLSEQQRKITTFDFDQKIKFNVTGQIGSLMKINANFDTEATFDFENQLKLNYNGKEDQIIKKIEAGNIAFNTNNSLITGSQTLFGVKTKLQFGRLTSTVVFSQQKGQKSEINVAGGAQTSEFDFKADDYEANKHYFLSHYFRNEYDRAMESLPNVASGVNITRIEVWITNVNNAVEETRNIVAFSDLGEDTLYKTPGVIISDLNPTALPHNTHNSIYESFSNDNDIVEFSNAANKLEGLGYRAAQHFEKVESARLLPPSSYTINKRLGFITLNAQPLNNDEVLAVAFEYTFQGKTYQVGQFSTDGIEPPKALILKLLKSTIANPEIPMWDLMMKNVYNINAYQVNKEDFILNVFYNDPDLGVDINYIPRGDVSRVPLIQVLNMDKLDQNSNPVADGIFDFVDNSNADGGTINARNGRIFFPVIEPFGEFLKQKLIASNVPPKAADSIAFTQLYDSTKVLAQQRPDLNRFTMRGTYKSASGSEIALNALNIPQGSVIVTSGGTVLRENVDYTVDYNLGRVKIINEGLLQSQQPIKVSLESNSLFSVQQKTMIGTRFDYKVNKDFNLGATFMKLTERPITPKVNFGDEPINNTVIGLDGSFQSEAPFITKLVDKLPFIETKAPSSITANAEFAQLIPGHSKAIGGSGTAYVDDFEATQSTIDLRSFNMWSLASTPQGQDDIFPEAKLANNTAYNFDRGMLAWHIIDPLFFVKTVVTPGNISAEMQSNHTMRMVREREIFPNRELIPGTPSNISVLDLAFYPSERGPYNYTTNLNPDGTLIAPEESWAGISRRITTNNFENSNIEFIQFWLMDPFNEDSPNQTGGKLYFNLGNISEDILRDARKSFENGLPRGISDVDTDVDTTVWGRVPRKQSIVNAFDNTNNSTKIQDVGLDGLNNSDERSFFKDYINQVTPILQPEVLESVVNDPSNDDYHYYRGSDYDQQNFDILERYKRYNNSEGNSPTQADSPEGYPTSATSIPSTEDLNLDNSLSESESYFQYELDLRPSEMQIGKNYITNIVEAVPNLRSGANKPVKWYQFKIPVRSYDKAIGGMRDFRSIRFIRMFMREFSQPVVLRFARLELVRGDWRKYQFDLSDPDNPPVGGDPLFDVAAVNLEENATKEPVNYALPPGITREIDAGSTNLRQINEQALLLKTCDLEDGDARAAFKATSFDVRSYKKLKMFVHAESVEGNNPIRYGDATVFIRMGSDYNNNYYEYEYPVTPTPLGQGPYSAEAVWPSENDLSIDFKLLQRAKRERNKTGAPLTQEYIYEGDAQQIARVRVKGNPVLSEVKTMMIGIRNPSAENNKWNQGDFKRPVCIEVWVNELRLNDFIQQGGWAAVGRVSTNLADLGNLSVAGNISKPGYGSIERKVNERQRETKKGFDVSTNLELGKFLPEKSGIKVPMYFAYSQQTINPQFDPLSPDLELDESLNDLPPDSSREKHLRKVQDYVQRRSINFTNVRKERTNKEKKQRFYDIENFSGSYSYNETFARNVNIERNVIRDYKVGLTYAFSNKPKSITPLENKEFLNKKLLKPIQKINFGLGFKQVSFRSSVDRRYSENLIRNNSEFGLDPLPTVSKTFTWNRAYTVKYDLTKSIKIDFNANNNAIIREAPGIVNKSDSNYTAIKQSIVNSFKEFGTTTNYLHNINATYQLPFKQIEYTDWINSELTYAGSYEWMREPFSQAQDSIGHTIQNSRTINLNVRGDMARFYTKIPYLKRLEQKKRRIKRKQSVKSRRKVQPNKTTTDTTATSGKKKIEGLTLLESFASFLTSLNNANFTYKRTEGSLLPGYGQGSRFVGMNPGFNAPGLPFVLGHQDENYPEKAANKGWLVKQPELYQPYSRSFSEQINLRLSFEPIKDMRLSMTFNSDKSVSYNSFFRYVNDSIGWQSQSPSETGNYTTTIFLLNTAFAKDKEVTFRSDVFDDYLKNRSVISQRLGEMNGLTVDTIVDNLPYYEGYSTASSEVVIPAFIAAYTGKKPGKVTLNPFKMGLNPNWNLSYNGLGKIPAIRKKFRNISISHGYQASYSTSYVRNIQARDENNERTRNASGDFIPDKQINLVSLTESFSPLFKLDMTWKNGLNTSIEIRKERRVSLSLSNFQITEDKSTDYVFGAQYRIRNVKFPFKIEGKDLKNDLNLRADVTIRKNIMLIRRTSEDYSEATAGRTSISIKATADYVLSQKVSLRAYFERQIIRPALSLPFPTSNTNAGITVRFTLTQ